MRIVLILHFSLWPMDADGEREGQMREEGGLSEREGGVRTYHTIPTYLFEERRPHSNWGFSLLTDPNPFSYHHARTPLTHRRFHLCFAPRRQYRCGIAQRDTQEKR